MNSIIFTQPEIRMLPHAEIGGTIRPIKGQSLWWKYCFPHPGGGWIFSEAPEAPKPDDKHGFLCPFGKVGDTLWIKEAYYVTPIGFGDGADDNCSDSRGNTRYVSYYSDNKNLSFREAAGDYRVYPRPAKLMPRWASRYQILIRDIFVKHLSDFLTISNKFYWSKYLEKRGLPTDPWVWHICFVVL